MPFLTATLVMSVVAKPRALKSTVVISVGASGLARLTTCSPTFEVVNRRSLPASKAEISAPARVSEPATSKASAPVGVIDTGVDMSKLATSASWSLAWLANSALI